MTLDPERRAALVAAKLGALVREAWGDAERRPVPFGGGAALVDGNTAWVLADAAPTRVLGGAVVWSRREGVDRLCVLVDDADGAPIVARRAGAFAAAPEVWRVDGRSVRPAVPAPFSVSSPVPPEAEALRGTLEASGVEVVVEHGVLSGEVQGLEVARVIVDDQAGARIEVGVGRHDREAFAMIHGDLPTPDALAAVVEAVLAQRRPDASPHPLNRLAAERWLRARVMGAPSVVGARALAPVDPPLPRDNVKDPAPAVALGVDDAGAPVIVACSAGVDLALVPTAADARAWHAPDARLVLLVAEKDDHPATRMLAAALTDPAEVQVVTDDWRVELTLALRQPASER